MIAMVQNSSGGGFFHVGQHIIMLYNEINLSSSLQTLGLPAANPAYPLTCSSPCVAFKFLRSGTTNPKTPKP